MYIFNQRIDIIILKIKRIFFLLRYKTSNHGNDSNRANEREKRIILASLTSLVARVIQMGVAFISVPLTVNYLGPERYGMMMTLMSFLLLMSFVDLGLGLGLQNAIPSSNNKIKLKKNISTAFFTLCLISTIIALIFIVIYPLIPWFRLFNAHSRMAINEAGSSIVVMMVVFVISIPFSIIQRIQNGMQKMFLNTIWQIWGNVISLAFLFLTVYLKLGTPYIILSVYGTNVIFTILNWSYFFFFQRRDLFPNPKYLNLISFKELFSIGGIFFILQLFTLIGSSSDSIIIAQYLGAASVAIYAIGFRLYQLLIIPVQVVLEPSWPALNEAFFMGDYAWIKKTIKRNFLFAITSSIFLALILIVFGEFIVRVWIGKGITVPVTVIIAFAFLIFNANIGGAFCSILNTEKFLKVQLILIVITNVFVVLLKIFLVKQFQIAGVIWGGVIGFALIYYLPAFLLIRRKIYAS